MPVESRDDLVKRLREWGVYLRVGKTAAALLAEAATRIEADAKRIERLETRVESFEADRPFHEAQAAKIKRLEGELRDEKATAASLLVERSGAAKRIAELEVERDRLRRKLSLYADATELHGMSWNGFNLIGDEKSIKELRRIENRSSQLEQYTAEHENRIASLQRALAEERERCARIADELAAETDRFAAQAHTEGSDETAHHSSERAEHYRDVATAIRSGKP